MSSLRHLLERNRAWAARLGWWAAMVAAWLFAQYSYLFSAFMLPAAGLVLLVWLGLRFESALARLGGYGNTRLSRTVIEFSTG